MPTNPPTNPIPGAVYVDRVTSISYVWTGVYWLQAHGGSQNYNSQSTPTTSIVPGFYAEPSPDTWVPHVGATAPLNPGCGQIWVNTSALPYVASIWDCISATFIPLGGGAGGDTNSIVSTVAPTIRVAGDPLQSGDIWINPATAALSFWNGASWVQISTPDTHSIFSAAEPSTRLNGDALLAGDLWTDPDNGNIWYFDGAAWQPVQAVDGDNQLSPVAPTLRPNGDPLATGDMWTNTVSNTLFYFDGAAWVRYNDTHSIQSATAPLVRPSGDALSGGDQWFDPTTNLLYAYDTTSAGWVLVTTRDTHSFRSSGVAPVVRTSGEALQDGDMWFNTLATENRLHVYDATSFTWTEVRADDLHSFVGAGAPALVVRPDGSALEQGDMYVDDVSQQGYYWDGLTWNLFGADTHSFIGVGDPLVGNPTTTRPNGTALQDGDLYIDTATRQGYYYNTATTTWVLFGSDTHSFTGVGEPVTANPVTTRPNGTALVAGDQYLNTATSLLYAWTGATWVIISGDTHSFTGAGDPTVTNPTTVRPDGSPLVNGDLYIDTVTHQGYYYNTATTAWVLFGSDTHSFTGAGNPTTTNPVTTRPNGTALVAGDQYLDTNNRLLYSWTGLAWALISGDTHSYTGVGDPVVANPVTTRPDGTALVAGDLYLNTANGLLYGWTGLAWVVFSNYTHSFTGAGAPALVTRTDGTPLVAGDQYVNTANNVLYFWDGAQWEVISSDTHAFTGNTVPVLVARPDGTPLVTGDQYLNTATNLLYSWTGAVWALISGDTHSFIGAAAPTLTARPDGSALVGGDLYIDTTSELPYYWDGAAWVLFGSDTHSFTGAGVPSLTTRPNGTALVTGDQYVNTNNNTLYFWDGAQWEVISNDTHAFVGTDTALLTARPDGTPLQTGDLFIDTDNDNRLYFRTAAATWETVSDDTHSQVTPGPSGPTTRADGTTLQVGDQWVDSSNGYRLHVWDFTVTVPTGEWLEATVPDTHSFVSNSDLTTRPDGTALQDGDQMYLTSTSPWTLRYWNTGLGTWVGEANQSLLLRTVSPVNGADSAVFGTVWHNTVTLDSWEFVENPVSPGNGLWKQLIQEPTIQFAAAAPTTQANGLPLIDGDIYYNTTNTLSFIYNRGATTWVPFGNDTHSFPQTVVPGTRPSGAALTLGDKWIDTDFAPAIEYYRSAANTWLPVGNVSTVTALPAAGEYANQLLVNSTNNRLYRYDSTAVAWVQVV